MKVAVRDAVPQDVPAIGKIVFEAFKTIAEEHDFPPDMPSVEMATGLADSLVSDPGFWGIVAELDGRVVGSNFLDERSPITGLGPITVDPGVQNQSVGRCLMEHALSRVTEDGRPGVRLVQATYHNRSLSLYSKLGFEARTLLSCLQGAALGVALPGYVVRPATVDDIAACDALCVRVHGHHRHGELVDAVARKTAMVTEHAGRIVGYASAFGVMGHLVGTHNDALKALIGAAPAFVGPGILVPTENGELLRWCFDHGLRIVQPMTLMTIGLYNQPAGPYVPSVLY